MLGKNEITKVRNYEITSGGIALVVLLLASGCATREPATRPAPTSAPAPAITPERSIQRHIPITNAISRAYKAATRDSTGRPGRNYWQTSVSYNISARLDEKTHVVTGRETVVVRNNSDSTWQHVQLRLDQNIYRPDAVRLATLPEITEGMNVTRMVVNGVNHDLAIPTNRVGITTTTMRVPLPSPVAPRGSVTLEIDWNFRVPNVPNGRGLRMGRMADSVYQVAQWYPRVAVYDDLRGWDTEPYLGPSEFYNNYGSFDVRIDVPAGWIVGATGVLQNGDAVLTPTARTRLATVTSSDATVTIVGADERGAGRSTQAGARLVWHFRADTVSDFAWATSDRYVWEATRATIPGKGPIPINIYRLPSHTENYARVPTVVRHALEFYSKLWMPYAWAQFTVTDGPELGMEYPMFIMSAIGAADHETAHEWWPMMVQSNETWYGFMDEGFDRYSGVLSRADSENRPAVFDSAGQRYGRMSGNESEGPLMWNANYGGPSYRYQAYEKSPLMLSMLGGVVGDTAVQRAMSAYAHAWRFKHPSPWDFAFFMSNALGRDLGWFWYYWLFTTESVDGSIVNVKTQDGTTLVRVRQDGGMPSPVVLRATFTDGTSQTWRWPVDVWFGGSRTFDATLDTGSRVVANITLDPAARFPDRVVTDNIWPRP